MSLDKLRKLDEAASPGPWSVFRLGLGDRHGADDCVVAGADGQNLLRNWGTSRSIEEEDANAKLAYLSHFLLPAMEFVEGKGCDEGPGSPGDGKSHCDEANPCPRCTVLAQLEEALK